ncbi:ankyrin repeat-containing domain protein [Bisporella sp. PMI_857]|nr:ankyrin repeat-containing domain protein [Bisporella sp. PMI_857]
MDLGIQLREAQAPISQDLSRSLPQPRNDKWNAYKDEIYRVYIQQNNTLEKTMQIIVDQGGPKASKRTWKSKLKEWAYEKNLTSNDMKIISAKADKRKRDDGKDTVFYHWDSEIPPEKIKRFRRTPNASEIVPLSAETPPNIRYHTPRPEHQTESTEIRGDRRSKSPLALDFLTHSEFRTQATHHPISEVNDFNLYELSTVVIARDEIAEISTSHSLIADLQATTVDWQQDLHFMPDRVPGMPSSPFLQSSFPHFNEHWMDHDFDYAFSGTNPNRAPHPLQNFDLMSVNWDASIMEGCDAFLRGSFNTTPSAEEGQAIRSISAGAPSSAKALYDIPWFLFQQLIKTTGSLGYNSHMSQAFHSSTPSLDMNLTSLDLVHGGADSDKRYKFLSSLFRSPPGSFGKNVLPKFASKLQELIPESFDGEICSKLQLLFQPSNNYPLPQLTEFALYFLSNNIFNDKQTDEFLEWVTENRPKELLRSLFAIKTPTVDAFSEGILESTARTGNASTLQLLIDCGLDIRYLVGTDGAGYLKSSLLNGSIDVAHLLLDNEADVNAPFGKGLGDEPPLHLAILGRHNEMTSRLLEAGARVNTKVDNMTALSTAVLFGEADIVWQLLQAGADVDDGEIDGYETLDWAYFNEKGIYRMMLPMSRKVKTSLTMSGILSAAERGKQALSWYFDGERGENLNHPRRELESALRDAVAMEPNSSAISVLLKFGVDPNTETLDTSDCPLVWAAYHSNIDLVQRLLNAGARIDSSDALCQAASLGGGGNALRSAVEGDSLGNIKLLLSSGVDINDPGSYSDDYTLLARAARFAKIKTVEYLVDNGAMVNTPPSAIARITALQGAAAAGKLEVVKFLIGVGADVNAEPSSCDWMTALEASLDAYELKEESTAIFQLLLEKGADINGPDKERCCKTWNSALVTLITKGADSQLIQRALDAGADINRRGKGEGARIPLQAAAEVGNLELVKQLLEKGAEINARPSVNHGRTALQAACSGDNPNLELVRYLLEKGAKVNAAAGIKRGLTALQGAAIRGHIKISLVLLEAGAEVNAEHGRLDIVKMLLNLGAKSEVPGDTGFDNAIKLAKGCGNFAVGNLLEAQSKP